MKPKFRLNLSETLPDISLKAIARKMLELENFGPDPSLLGTATTGVCVGQKSQSALIIFEKFFLNFFLSPTSLDQKAVENNSFRRNKKSTYSFATYTNERQKLFIWRRLRRRRRL